MNRFYSEFDHETFPAPRTRRVGEERTPFEIDRDRIIFSEAFRRLQSKTQVFQSGEYDFYRTRLTHSLEVAQIGRGIALHLQRRGGPLAPDFFIDADLVEACCLAHDLGHPPFGHAGEQALHTAMRGHGGFEGNAQTLRILTDLLLGSFGMKPTRALLDGTLKYQRLFSTAGTRNHFLYDDQIKARDFVLGGEDFHDTARSIECQIMDWADDAAYGLMDMVDGVKAGFITLDALLRWRRETTLVREEIRWLRALAKALIHDGIPSFFAKKVGACVTATSLRPRTTPLASRTHRHAFDLVIDSGLRAEIDFYKRVAVDLIFHTPQIKQLERKGQRLLQRIFTTLADNYARQDPDDLVPANVGKTLATAPDETARLRVLCDYVSGMTDSFAVRTYRRLFDPGYGSITDL